MKILSGNIEYFALDIGTSAVRVLQLVRENTGWALKHYAVVPISIQLSSSDSADDQKRLGEAIMSAVGQSGVTTKNVVMGIPSSKTFATVIEMPDMPEGELAATIKYQADQYIPTPLDESKVDWAMLGKPLPTSQKNEVLLVSTANNYVETRLDIVESLGFDVIAIEPESIALVRALQSESVSEGRVIVEMGDFTTDIVMTYGEGPRLIRSIPTGAQSLVKAVVQNLNVEPQQAQQFIAKFGLAPDKLEGQVFRAAESTASQIVAEIAKSIKFFQTRYPSIPVNQLILSNYALTIPGFSSYLSEKVGIGVEAGNPWKNVRVSQVDQTTLQPLSAQFSVVVGLAERGSR